MGGYHTRSAGDLITAANHNTYIRDQTINQFASSAARDSAITSPAEGMYADLADSDSTTRYSGSAWVVAQSCGSWTDFSSSAIISVTAGVYTKGSTTYSARYLQQGKRVDYSGTISIDTGGGFSAGASIWSFLLPVTAQAALVGTGSAYLKDNGTALYAGVAILSDSTHFQIIKDGATTQLDSNGPGTAWATGDQIRWSIRYEAA